LFEPFASDVHAEVNAIARSAGARPFPSVLPRPGLGPSWRSVLSRKGAAGARGAASPHAAPRCTSPCRHVATATPSCRLAPGRAPGFRPRAGVSSCRRPRARAARDAGRGRRRQAAGVARIVTRHANNNERMRDASTALGIRQDVCADTPEADQRRRAAAEAVEASERGRAAIAAQREARKAMRKEQKEAKRQRLAGAAGGPGSPPAGEAATPF
jgi:hypothetical protein